MTRVAWVNAANGVAGDMLLAALIDAGADRLAVIDAWAGLGLDGYAATWEVVDRAGVRALWTNLVIDDHDDHEHPSHHPHRPAREVLELLAAADLPPAVSEAASKVYRELAAVEGAIHGVDAFDVELHEVGALDSILDIVGVSAALSDLGVDELYYGPIGVGHGTVTAAHGSMPNPVPAVARLVERHRAMVRGVDTEQELSTPTGVAVLTVLGSCRPLPTMTVHATGYGAGRANPAQRPNVSHVMIGERDDGAADQAVVIETNVDDVTGEVLAHTIDRLLAAGAHDAWATPIVMKKGRPAHTVSALCADSDADTCRRLLLSETGSLGARSYRVDRSPLGRIGDTVDIDGHQVRRKIVTADGVEHIKVEHDDALAAAMTLGRPLRVVLAEASALPTGRRPTP